ncbi:hypothetical protein C8R44DRAFT_888339 [Mycena epipterygia]|nr:hypothetical protein C8R44DRAFT_888339 [Mycena epipterygia]
MYSNGYDDDPMSGRLPPPPQTSHLPETYPPDMHASAVSDHPQQNDPSTSHQAQLPQQNTPSPRDQPSSPESPQRRRRQLQSEEPQHRVKVHYVQNEPYEEQLTRLREDYMQEKQRRKVLEGSLARLEDRLNGLKDLEKYARDHIGPVPGVDDDADMEDYEEELKAERKERTKDAARYEKDIRTLKEQAEAANREITALREKAEGASQVETELGTLKRTIVEQADHIAGFLARPTSSLHHVPQSHTKETCVARKVHVVRSQSRPLPTNGLKSATEAESDGDSEDEELGDDEMEELLADNPGLERLILEVVKRVMATRGRTRNASIGSGVARQPTARRQAVIEQQNQITREQDLLWKRVVRAVWREQYKTYVADDFKGYETVAKSKVKECNAGKTVPASDDYTLDFNDGWNSSLWNLDVVGGKLTQRVQAAYEAGSRLPKVSDAYIAGLFYNQLKQAQGCWKELVPRFLPHKMAWEMPEEVADRVKSHKAKRSKDTTIQSSKRDKYKRRLKTVEVIIQRNQAPQDIEKWKYLLDVLKRLEVEGMSSEEEGTVAVDCTILSIYKVKLCAWRAKPIQGYMDDIDVVEKDTKKATGGRQRTPRMRIDREGNSSARAGLPEQMYDPDWLVAQKRSNPAYVLHELKVLNETFQLLAWGNGKGKVKA